MANPDRNTSTPLPNPNAPSRDREDELRAPTKPEQAAPSVDPVHSQPDPRAPDVSIGKGPATRESERQRG